VPRLEQAHICCSSGSTQTSKTPGIPGGSPAAPSSASHKKPKEEKGAGQQRTKEVRAGGKARQVPVQAAVCFNPNLLAVPGSGPAPPRPAGRAGGLIPGPLPEIKTKIYTIYARPKSNPPADWLWRKWSETQTHSPKPVAKARLGPDQLVS
jgi:hypothetical protein